MTDEDTSLAELRAAIDSIDDQIQALLMRRSEVVLAVGRAKEAAAGRHPPSFLRPSREAMMLRRLVANHDGAFPKGVLVQLWHEIIGAMVRLEGPFSVAVPTGPAFEGLWDLARNQYGGHAPLQAAASPLDALAAVTAGRVVVAVLPWPGTPGSAQAWWTASALHAPDGPRVFARLPFGDHGCARPAADGTPIWALAVGRVDCPATGRDRTLAVIETDGLDAETIHARMARYTLDSRVLGPAPGGIAPSCVEIAGTPETVAPALEALGQDGAAPLAARVIGGYAEPFAAGELG